MPLEIEAKFLNVDAVAIRKLLAAHGYTCMDERRLLRRYTFLLSETLDNLDGSKWGRVRDEGNRVTMTYKHAFDRSRIDGTEEVEFEVSDFDAAVVFMGKLGFENRLYQENYREAWQKDGVEVTVNEWPALSPLVEIEAADEDLVRNASAELGFDFGTAVFGGVGSIYKLCNGWDMNFVDNLTFARADEIASSMNARMGGVA
ncbi:MAG: CYTH domain-containing protein [Alphaproteobacteria bacterium]|nr:MAG: CYTH domain-containing protein [Alphaproteobacteria bacterium]